MRAPTSGLQLEPKIPLVRGDHLQPGRFPDDCELSPISMLRVMSGASLTILFIHKTKEYDFGGRWTRSGPSHREYRREHRGDTPLGVARPTSGEPIALQRRYQQCVEIREADRVEMGREQNPVTNGTRGRQAGHHVAATRKHVLDRNRQPGATREIGDKSSHRRLTRSWIALGQKRRIHARQRDQFLEQAEFWGGDIHDGRKLAEARKEGRKKPDLHEVVTRLESRFHFAANQAQSPRPMKLLVFAHVPPPVHGQSQMVQYLVDGFRTDPSLGIEVSHVDARLSDSLEDVGSARGGKLTRLLAFVIQALRLRWRHGIHDLYYVPSPPKRNSLYRDWILLALLRPWFRRVHFHWHAVGLGEWLETQARPWERHLSHRLLGGISRSIVLSEFSRPDAERLAPKSVRVVSNGIPDPCPEFATQLASERQRRFSQRRDTGGEVRVLFLALCSRDKGVFDALEAVSIANVSGANGAHRLRFQLAVAGTFPNPELEREFKARIRELEMDGSVRCLGFVQGEAKRAALREADLFLFPTYYAAEGQPLNLMEAMAHGLPVVTTRWRAIPDLVPLGHPGLVPPRDPAAAAQALVSQALHADGLAERAEFERRFSLPAHLRALAEALRA